jgi:hypothetical protein
MGLSRDTAARENLERIRGRARRDAPVPADVRPA